MDYHALQRALAEAQAAAEAARAETEALRAKAEAAEATAEAARAEKEALRAKVEAAEATAEADRAEKEALRTKTEAATKAVAEANARLAETSFHGFLKICHENIFLQLKIEQNELMRTSGGLTRVDGKVYPRELLPWGDFDSRLEASFALLETIFQQDALFPSPAGLGYLEGKLRDKKLASEEDLKSFECLAVEGCTEDILPSFIKQLKNGGHGVDSGGQDGSNSPAILAKHLLRSISFNNYPYGVIATEEDEEDEQDEQDEQDGQDEQDEPRQQDSSTKEDKDDKANKDGKDGKGASSGGRSPTKTGRSRRTPSRGVSRGRTRQRASSSKSKPLQIKDDRPAYIGALGVAKRDMDAAIERAAAEAEERERSGPPSKRRQSPDRSKVHPDQWCFRHNTDNTSRPLFVIEYKAAHKIDLADLRSALAPATAATLMRDVLTARGTNKSGAGGVPGRAVAYGDVAKVFAQTYHYMVDYGLQYCYATTGPALIFLYLDPKQPSSLFYHLEEPAQGADTTSRDGLKHTAVGLVTSFVLMALQGQHMTNRWKKAVHKAQPKWPTPYDDASNASTAEKATLTPGIVFPIVDSTAGAGCRDPQKRDNNRRRDQDDDESGGGGGNRPADATPGAARRPAGAPTTAATTTAPTTTAHTAGKNTNDGAQQAATWKWWRPVDAPLTPSLEYCTQNCLLGLKTGGAKDPRCPNVHLHRRPDEASDGEGDSCSGRHPITAEELRVLLVQQLAEDMDTDCHSLERFGMYGAIGALFKLALSAYGYCLVGKGVQRAHRKVLQREAAAYGLLQACQGRLVPVNLGIIHLVDEYWTECGAHITDMMLMAYAGDSLWHVRRAAARNDAEAAKRMKLYHYQADLTLHELQQYGVEHGDEDETNLAWNAELQRVLAIDLDRAVFSVPPQRRKASAENEDVPDAKRVRGH